MNKSQWKEIFKTGIFHTSKSLQPDDLINKILGEYYYQLLHPEPPPYSGSQIDQEPSYEKATYISVSMQKIFNQMISGNYHHLAVITIPQLQNKVLRPSAIPFLLRNLPPHSIESYFLLRLIGEKEMHVLKHLNIGFFLNEDIPIHHSLPTPLIATSIIYKLIRYKEQIIGEIPDLLDGLSPYKAKKLLSLTGRFFPMLAMNTTRDRKIYAYLNRAHQFLHEHTIIPQLLKATSAKSLQGITQYLTKNHESLVDIMTYPVLIEAPKSMIGGIALLRFIHPRILLSILQIDLVIYERNKSISSEEKTILLLLIEAAAWHNDSGSAAQFVVYLIRHNCIDRIPEHVCILLFDVMSIEVTNSIWSSIHSLDLTTLLDVNVYLQNIKSHALPVGISNIFISLSYRKWKSYIESSTLEDIDIQLMVLFQSIHMKEVANLQNLLKRFHLPDEINRRVEIICYIRFQLEAYIKHG